jgi:hypothetical protein
MNYKELQELDKAVKRWTDSFDKLKGLIGDNIYKPDTYISTMVRTEPFVRKPMRLLYLSVSHSWIDDDIVLHFINEDNPDKVLNILVSRAFEAKAFGDVREIEQLFDFLISLFNNNQMISKSMAKVNYHKKGTLVSAKKFNGETVLGIYQHSYDDGSHCISDGKKQWCINPKDLRLANEEETKIIQETIIKPQREAEKKAKAEAEAAARAEAAELLTEEDFEEAAEPTEEELDEAMEASETTEEE